MKHWNVLILKVLSFIGHVVFDVKDMGSFIKVPLLWIFENDLSCSV